jgi:hypothetical protein
MTDFIVKSTSDLKDENAITFKYKKNNEQEIRKLYIRKISTSLALRISDVVEKINKINQLPNEQKNKIETIKELYNLFLDFLKLTIINYDENLDLIQDLPIENEFIEEFIKKIQEKMLYSNNIENPNLKKKTRRSCRKKIN